MLQNASSLAIVAVDTEENEPIKNEVWWVRRHFLGPRPEWLSPRIRTFLQCFTLAADQSSLREADERAERTLREILQV